MVVLPLEEEVNPLVVVAPPGEDPLPGKAEVGNPDDPGSETPSSAGAPVDPLCPPSPPLPGTLAATVEGLPLAVPAGEIGENGPSASEWPPVVLTTKGVE